MTHTGDTAIYEIRLQGHIDLDWSSWLAVAVVAQENGGTTTIVGEVRDQAALHGALARIRDLGLVILSIKRVAARSAHSSPQE